MVVTEIKVTDHIRHPHPDISHLQSDIICSPHVLTLNIYKCTHTTLIIFADFCNEWRGGGAIPEEQSRRDLILFQPSARSKNQCKNVMVSRSGANTQCDGATVAVTPDFIGLWI